MMKGPSPQNRTDSVTSLAGGRCRGSPSPASLLVATVADLLAMKIETGHMIDSVEFFDLCLSLARGIDYAVANNEIPLRARDLPLLLKQVYKHNNDSLQAAVMVLMISVKYACKIGWFSDKDANDLLKLAKEMGENFCNMDDINVEPSYGLPYISKIMSRFYPHIKMDRILASLEVKPGYKTFVTDFYISRSMMAPVQEQIFLFVAQTDSLDTSSCIVTPPQVNFLLNGKGVQGRINVSLDNGPQLPTNVTAMVKDGINLLQAVGKFNGHYMIVMALISMISSSDTPVLQDYVQPVVAVLDSDLEIKEGPSRISLNCPISQRRIRTPVKGHACKHHQCFDYDNFMGINARLPSWRCPHCNQSVCYPDIRIDQNIVKVLKEVSENVVEVTISTDGSWKAVLEGKDHMDQTYDRTHSCQQDVSEQCESVGFSNISAHVDLTVGGDNSAGDLSILGREGREPFLSNLQGFSITKNLVPQEVNNTITVDQIASAQLEDNFWSRILLAITSAPFGSTAPANSDAQMDARIFDTPPFNYMLSPVLTDAVSPALSRESTIVHGEAQLTISLPQNQLFDPHNLQLLQSRAESSSNDFGRLPSLFRKVSCTPSEIHTVLAQAQGPSSCQQTRALNSSVPNIVSSTSHSTNAPNMDVFDAVNRGTESDLQFPRSLMNSFPVLNEASTSTQHCSVTQNWVDSDHPHVSSKSAQHVVGLPTQGPDSCSIPTRPPPSQLQNPNHSIPPEWRTTHIMAESLSKVHPSILVQSVQTQRRGGGGQATAAVTNKQAPPRAAQVSRTPPSVPVLLRPSRTGTTFSLDMVAKRLKTTGEQRQNMGGMTRPISMTDGSAALASKQNWRPSGRMRGSLTGNAYSAALSQSMIRPTQPVQDCQSPSNLTSTLNGGLQMRGLITNSTSAYTNSQAQTYPRSGDAANQPENSGSLPEQSLGKQYLTHFGL